ncbi:hypothetical protein SAMN04487949_0925 [Halogranum gelatinilyticum]|uniref:Mut7-C RNAse domain-containing protein n=1 Tax=Halogranum gelatinilyticum TaxID=660521 RepID=A0A1G9QM36_9EURY|nr:Mut7-C RNAse domain-containing protein [Halogranum gelatinilyticum]SDM11950.1 hypothetical protein SAMN04487949_0925 [Halogranum gelatinilyticum]
MREPGERPVDADGRPRLLLDVMLGKLATYLRMCGYDAAYALDRDAEADERVLDVVADEGRLLLTRDRQLASRASDSLLLTEREVTDQLRELRAVGFVLELDDEPAYCGRCNGPVEAVDDGEPRPEYAPDDGLVWQCRDCGQFFWKGSHWDDVRERLENL